MRYLYDRVWHYLSSNSRHGTHSPFVYKLADEVIYKSPDKGQYINGGMDKVDALILEISLYLGKELNLTYPEAIVQVDITEYTLEAILELYMNIPVLILKNIYTDNAAKQKWSALKADQTIVVTIDLFYFGIIIFRKEQPKENFKLRFPYAKY